MLERHHILQLSFRHAKAELTRKAIAADGLARERDELRAQLEVRYQPCTSWRSQWRSQANV